MSLLLHSSKGTSRITFCRYVKGLLQRRKANTRATTLHWLRASRTSGSLQIRQTTHGYTGRQAASANMSWESTVCKIQSFQSPLLNLPAVSDPCNSKGTLISSVNLVTSKLRHVKRIRLLQTEKELKKVIHAGEHVQRS